MATTRRDQKQALRDDYGTGNIKKASRIESLEQSQRARELATNAARMQDPLYAAKAATEVQAAQPVQRESVNIDNRAQLAGSAAQNQAAARAAGGGAQQQAQMGTTNAIQAAQQAVQRYAARRADAERQALGGLQQAGAPTFAEQLGQNALQQGVSTAIGTGGALLGDVAGLSPAAQRQEEIKRRFGG